MQKVDNQERTAGLHYFFPANVNRLVEVIRQKKTSDETYQALMDFTRNCAKVAISVKDFPGFAINPVFISNYMVLNSFLGDQYNVATLESVSQEALNVKYGIMWVQNGSGLGTAYHAAVSMYEYLHDSAIGYPPVPPQLKEQLDSGEAFNLADGPVLQDSNLRKRVKDRLLGNVFTIVTHLIENEVVSVKDLELGIRTSLAWPKGPFSMMNEIGMAEAARLVKLSVEAGDFAVPRTFQSGVPSPWEL
jgi:3-hydroxyacyl-CoA dehydrogenase